MHELSLQEGLFGKRRPLPQGPFLPVRQMRTNTWPAPVTRLSVLLFPGPAAQRHSAELSEGLQSRRSQGGASSPGREHVTSKGYLGESGVQAPAPNLEEGGKEERREALREKMKLRPAWAWMTRHRLFLQGMEPAALSLIPQHGSAGSREETKFVEIRPCHE